MAKTDSEAKSDSDPYMEPWAVAVAAVQIERTAVEDVTVERIVVVPAVNPMAVATCVRNGIVHVIVRQIVVEARPTAHLFHESGEISFGILAGLPHPTQRVVPMALPHERTELKWITGIGGVNRAQAAGLVYGDRRSVAPAAYLVIASSPNEMVVDGIHGEEHANPTIGIGVQHDQIAILLGTYLDADSFAPFDGVSLIEPDLDRGILHGDRGHIAGRGHGRGGNRQR